MLQPSLRTNESHHEIFIMKVCRLLQQAAGFAVLALAALPVHSSGESVQVSKSSEKATHTQTITIGERGKSLQVSLRTGLTSVSCLQSREHIWYPQSAAQLTKVAGRLVVSHPELAQALGQLEPHIRLGDPLTHATQEALAASLLPHYDNTAPAKNDEFVSLKAARNPYGHLQITLQYILHKQISRAGLSPCHPIRNIVWLASGDLQHQWFMLAWGTTPYEAVVALLTAFYASLAEAFATGVSAANVIVVESGKDGDLALWTE